MTPNSEIAQSPITEQQKMHTTEAILVAVARLEGKVDNLMTSLRAHDSIIEKQETRLASLERWRAYMIGAAVASGGVAGLTVEKLLS